MTEPSTDTPRHPIRVVARRTGLTTSVLRAWERRYGVVTPGRSEGGQRLYSDAHVHRLTMLAQAIAAGRSISQVAVLTDDGLSDLLEDDARVRPPAPPTAQGPSRSVAADTVLADSIASVEQLDASRLESQLMKAAVLLNPATLIDDVVLPLLERIGLLWEHGVVGPATEHVASVTVRKFLDWLLRATDVEDGAPGLVCATPSGHRHEFGALIAAVSGAYAGWRTTFLGADLPPEEIAAAAGRVGASVVAVSAVFPIDDPTLPNQISRLVTLAAPGTRILVGGPAVLSQREDVAGTGAVILENLAEFRDVLSSLRTGQG